MRYESQKATPNKAEAQKQLAELVQKVIAIVEDRTTHWHNVAEFVNMRLSDPAEHLTPVQAEKIAEVIPDPRYNMLVAAAVGACEEKRWQDVANLVNFQLETVRDGKLTAEEVRKIASQKHKA